MNLCKAFVKLHEKLFCNVLSNKNQNSKYNGECDIYCKLFIKKAEHTMENIFVCVNTKRRTLYINFILIIHLIKIVKCDDFRDNTGSYCSIM